MMGVGSVFKITLKRAGISSCSRCDKLARRMDRAGPNWCRGHIEWILDEIRCNAILSGRGGFFSRRIARRMLLKAIKKVEKNRQ